MPWVKTDTVCDISLLNPKKSKLPVCGSTEPNMPLLTLKEPPTAVQPEAGLSAGICEQVGGISKHGGGHQDACEGKKE